MDGHVIPGSARDRIGIPTRTNWAVWAGKEGQDVRICREPSMMIRLTGDVSAKLENFSVFVDDRGNEGRYWQTVFTLPSDRRQGVLAHEAQNFFAIFHLVMRHPVHAERLPVQSIRAKLTMRKEPTLFDWVSRSRFPDYLLETTRAREVVRNQKTRLGLNPALPCKFHRKERKFAGEGTTR